MAQNSSHNSPRAFGDQLAGGRTVGDREVTLGDLLGYLWFSRLRIAATALFSAAIAIFYLGSFSPNTYQALATVRLDPRSLNVVDVEVVQDNFSIDTFLLNTELRVLQSPQLLQQVIEELDLASNAEFMNHTGASSLARRIRSMILGRNKAAQEINADLRELEDAVRDVMDVKLLRETYIINIAVETQSPKLSVDIANAIADAYLDRQLSEKLTAAQEASDWLENELDGLSADLLTADRHIARLRAVLESTSELELQQNADQIRLMRARLLDLREQRAKLEMQVLADRPALTEMSSGQNRPDLTNIGATGQQEPASAPQHDRARLGRLNHQIAALERTLNGLTVRIAGRASDLNRLKVLERAQRNTEALHEKFSNRLRETALQYGLLQPDARLLDYAKLPNQPSGPRWLRTIAMATTAGLVLASLIVILGNLICPHVRSAHEWMRLQTVPLLAELPPLHARGWSVSGPLLLTDFFKELLPPGRRKDRVRHSLAELRTKLKRRIGEHQGIVMVTGSTEFADHAQLTASLASSFAALPGRRVLLIDMDLRDQTLSKSLSQNHAIAPDCVTLRDMLDTAEGRWDRPIAAGTDLCPPDVQGQQIDFIPAGAPCEVPLDIMAGETIWEVLEESRARYDWVFAALPVAHRGEIVPLAAEMGDHVVYAINCPSAQTHILRGLNALLNDTCPPLSPVLTNLPRPLWQDMPRWHEIVAQLKTLRRQA